MARAPFIFENTDPMTRLANIKSDGTTLSSFDYAYDPAGNRTRVVEATGDRVTWSYDATYQLTRERRSGANAYDTTYTYDAAGNRLLKIAGAARTTYAYNAGNQIVTAKDAGGTTTYIFDAAGNQTVGIAPTGRTTSTWDYENRRTRLALPDATRVTSPYEPNGLRVKIEDSSGTKKFVWDEQKYVAETDGRDATNVIYTDEPSEYGKLVSQRRGSTTNWYNFDALGSTRQLTYATQAITDSYLYDAWGVPISSVGATNNPFRYVGELGYYFDSTKELEDNKVPESNDLPPIFGPGAMRVGSSCQLDRVLGQHGFHLC